MNPEDQSDFVSAASDIASRIEAIVRPFWQPWVGYQILIAIALWFTAKLLTRIFGPQLYAWMRAREGWPKSRMKWLVLVHQRLTLIFFIPLCYLTVFIMRQITWPSRTYVLGLIANIALTWLVLVFLTRPIHNRIIRQLIRLGVLIWVALRSFNLEQQVGDLLRSIAIDIGSIHITLLMVLQALLALIILFYFARWLSRLSSSLISKNEDLSPSQQVLSIKFVQLLLYVGAFFMALRIVGVDLTGFTVLSGAIGLGLGFGLQKVVSNLVSGVIILLDKSIKPGDVISIGDTFGWIDSLGARYVSITTRDGREYLVPNEELITGQVINWSHTDDLVRTDIHFGASYRDSPHKVRELAVEAARSVPRVLRSRQTVCHIVGFGDSSINYVLRFWVNDPSQGMTNVRGNVYLALWDTFSENGISIPFPQREVRLLDDSPNERRDSTDP